MNLSSFVSKNMVTVNLRASTKRAAIAEIVGYICSRQNLANKNEILESILEREEKASTGIGDGVAIPHSRLPRLESVLFFVGISKPGIDFGAPDGKVAHIIFLFVTPETESQTHLKILSSIGNLQKNGVLLRKLIEAKSDAELFDILNYEQVQRESYYPLTRDEVYRELDTSEGGLSEYEARSRLEVYGQNRLRIIGTTPLIGRFLRYLVEPTSLLLWVAVLVGYAGGLTSIASIVVALIFVNAVASFFREFKAERAVDALRNFVPQTSEVIRGGRERRIATENLVPGDVLLLDEGDVIPADGRLIEANELRVDNSAFSGDPKPVYKSHDPVENREQFLWMEIPALVFAGTSVLAGNGKAVITSTGMDTELGQIAYLTQTIKNETSTLQREIARFARLSAVSILVLSAVAAIVALIVHGIGKTALSPGTVGVAATGIVLGLTATGLIPSITLVLLSAAGRMRRKGAVIKRLSSIETLGTTDVICTDKTGTLTTNEMCVRKLWLGGSVLDVSGEGYTPEGSFREDDRSIAGIDLGNSDYRIFFYDAALCNNARLKPPDRETGRWHIEGDPTEGALLSLVEKAEIEVETIRATYPAVRRFPFDSVRKRMSTVHAVGGDRGGEEQFSALVKGAPHELLGLSTKVLMEGRERPIDEALRASIDRQIDDFAASGMRVLGFAYRRLSPQQLESASVDDIEQGLVFTGITAMIDPPRHDARDAIRACRRAGIRVIMITGEYHLTALSIARRLGIVERPEARVISGKELSDSTDAEIRAAIEHEEIVFARVNPEHRLRIVRILGQMGKVVASTGDGISDAPVLKRADIGVAMGARGNPVTRATAEMVLLEDSFASIVAAVEEGRAVFANLRAMVSHLSSHLLPQGLAFLAFLWLSIPLPLSLGLVLLLDLFVDLLPAVAIGIRPPTRDVMMVPAEEPTHHLVNRATVTRSFLSAGLLVALLAFLTFGFGLAGGAVGLSSSVDLRPGTLFFLALVAGQLAFYVVRMRRALSFRAGRRSSTAALLAAALIAVGTVALVSYLPSLSRLFHTAALAGRDWIAAAVVFAVTYLVGEGATIAIRSRADGAAAAQAK